MDANFIRESAWQFALTLWHVLPWMAAMGAVFSVLSLFMPCNPGKPWWRKKGLVTDMTYLFIVPVFMRYARIGFAVMLAVYIVGTTLLGAWFTRRQKDIRTYFVGDRNVAWWLVLGVSGAAAIAIALLLLLRVPRRLHELFRPGRVEIGPRFGVRLKT